MTILMIFFALWFLASLLSSGSEDDRARERLLPLFIIEYEKQAGIILTREQAVALIQVTCAKMNMEEQGKKAFTQQHDKALDLAAELCKEAEDNALKKN